MTREGGGGGDEDEGEVGDCDGEVGEVVGDVGDGGWEEAVLDGDPDRRQVSSA